MRAEQLNTRALKRALLSMGLVVAACTTALFVSCSSDDESTVFPADSSTLPSIDATSDARIAADTDGTACSGNGCALTCDAMSTWAALSPGPGRVLGDPEPASPDEVGDGQWHLFVGYDLTVDGGATYVQIFDATSAVPDGTFTLGTALDGVDDIYDLHGKETPSYLRFDAHTEYIFYTADTTFAPPVASIAALKRVDGGAWTKVGIVAPFASGETTQIDPTVVRDPATGLLSLVYMSLVFGDGGEEVGLVARTSANPESFDAATLTRITGSASGANIPARPAISYDTGAGVWRVAFDVVSSYPVAAVQTLQSWSTSAIPSAAAFANGAVLHDGNHAFHLALHLDARDCDGGCFQGAVLQPSKAVYPNATDVIFYYAGWSDAPGMQVNGQRCARNP